MADAGKTEANTTLMLLARQFNHRNEIAQCKAPRHKDLYFSATSLVPKLITSPLQDPIDNIFSKPNQTPVSSSDR